MNATIPRYLANAGMGLALGVVLANIGFADYDEVQRMLALRDLRMFWSFVMAIVLAAAVFAVAGRLSPKQQKIFHPGVIPGSILFGIGWAVCGACPAIVFVQLGLGKLPALMTLLGIAVGVKSYRWFHGRFLRWDRGECGV